MPPPTPKEENNDYNPLYEGLPRFTGDQPNPAFSTPLAHHNHNHGPNTMAMEAPRSSSVGRKTAIDSLSGLRALPEVRPIPWATGKELPPDKSTESPRTQTRGAFLLSTRGIVRNPPCTHCATGAGRFALCISLEAWFQGACSTCQMATRGNLCSLRVESSGSPAEGKPKQNKREMSRNPPPNDHPTQNQNQPPASPSGFTPPQNMLKRKNDHPLPSPSAAPNNPFEPKNTDPIIRSIAQGPSTIPHSNPQFLNNRPPPPNSNFSSQPYQMESPPNKRRNIGNQPPNNLEQSQMQYHGHGNSYFEAGMNSGFRAERGRDVTTSASPSTQLLQPLPVAPQDRPLPSRDNPSHTETPAPAAVETPLIDTLPRRKQKQIFGILGGIQSGIRNVRQQADSLQKQLDSLQAALGIDGDDEDGGVM
ncbi:hypothetical protein G7Y89_g7534 [Cudoniella acicularis]|uniref:Uncharacterized protein n=1 Tax=Cudoniella acicularis TaxID=354080 RepID=A0A8H4RKL8_9HELO|nr:hypothetical protein G7Y89_g7534 [Cudoniella acicularis]